MLFKNGFVFISLLILLSPLFSNYVFLGALGYGDLLIFIAIFLSIFMLRLNRLFLFSMLALFSLFVISFFVLINGGYDFFSLLRATFYLFAALFLSNLNKEFYSEFLDVYLKIAYFFAIVLVIQTIFYYVSGLVFSLELPMVTYEESTLQIVDLENQGFRTGGLLKEPSYYAIFTIPAVYYVSFVKRSIKWHLFLVLSLFLSTSSLGIAFSLFTFSSFIGGNRKNKAALSLILVLILLVSVLLFFSIFHDVPWVSRFFEIFSGGGTLNDRFSPLIEVVGESGFFTSGDLYTKVTKSDASSIWYNSVSYLLSIYGWVFLLPLVFILSKVGRRFLIYISAVLLVTHAFATSYFTVFFMVFYSISLIDKIPEQ